MKEFREIDDDGCGFIQFLDFLRATCKKGGVHLPARLSAFEKLAIFEIIEFRHISEREADELRDGLRGAEEALALPMSNLD